MLYALRKNGVQHRRARLVVVRAPVLLATTVSLHRDTGQEGVFIFLEVQVLATKKTKPWLLEVIKGNG